MESTQQTIFAGRATDPSSVARTRGVLMALSRDRNWYFAKPVAKSLVVGALTLGLLPLLDQSRRLDRWKRLEWLQYAEAARWIGTRAGDGSLTLLATFAGRAAGKPSGRWSARACAAVALAILAGSAVYDGVAGVLNTAFVPVSGKLTAVLFSVVLSIGWLLHFADLRSHTLRVERWHEQVNRALQAHDRRPVTMQPTARTGVWMIVGIVVGMLGPLWLGMQTLVLALQNRYITSTQAARWQMCERLLEWMDQSGLPVEYDIEKLEPEQIAAMFT